MSTIHSSAGAGLAVTTRGRAAIATVGATVALAIGVLLTEAPDREALP